MHARPHFGDQQDFSGVSQELSRGQVPLSLPKGEEGPVWKLGIFRPPAAWAKGEQGMAQSCTQLLILWGGAESKWKRGGG